MYRDQRFITVLVVMLLLGAVAPGGASPPAVSDDAAEASPTAEVRQGDDASEAAESEMSSFFATTTVTATGRETDVFKVSTPVAVIDEAEIERKMPENAVDLLRYEPGVDVNGVGPNQVRPIIRGQRGLRVLFLENGLRMNNPRRQTDFGEISGLVSIDNVSTVEVVRGAASVLYGTDAVGGVLNLITRAPSYADGWRGSAGARYGSAGDQAKLEAAVERRLEKLSFRLGASYRDVDDYQAASGSFGAIRLDSEARVVDSGVQDDGVYGHLSYQFNDRHQLFGRFNRYRADRTGFGFVEPELLGGADSFRIRILYPFQDFDRVVVGYVGTAGNWADSIDAKLYHQSNERELQNDIDINIGVLVPGAPPSTVEADTLNFTDLDTFGGRIEATRGVGERNLLTWGAEFYQDDSSNTDSSRTTTSIRFPFPPFESVIVMTDDVANAPNASNDSYGLFVQDELTLGDRVRVTVGARYQTVSTDAEATPGWDVTGLNFDDDSLVGSVNAVLELSNNLNLVGSYGTAFRAPNIVERLFNGPTPEGAGFQILNPGLVSEDSESLDLGLKYRRPNAVFELIFFRSEIDDGIIQHFLTPAEVATLPADLQEEIRQTGVQFVVQQQNIDRLRYEGVEMVFGYRSRHGLVVGGNFTHIDSERLDSTNPPTGDTVTDKVNAYLRYEKPGSRYWGEYRVRHNGDERANLDPGEPIPAVGETLPSFTVHVLSGGVTLFERGSQRHALGIVIDNLTDELYAEFSNATFFRPQAKRNVTVSYSIRY